MEDHSLLDLEFVGGGNAQLIFSELATDAEPKVGMDLFGQRCVSALDEVESRFIGFTDSGTWSQLGNQVVLSIKGQLIGILLFLGGVEKQSSACHAEHLKVLSADIGVDHL
jgi:hypothetical protein